MEDKKGEDKKLEVQDGFFQAPKFEFITKKPKQEGEKETK